MEKEFKKILITTAIDYTNDVIHIGHAYQKILADCIVRYYRLIVGKENVRFLTGTDEFGSTSEKAAKEKGAESKQYVDDISSKDRHELDVLNISYDRFIRTTDEDHKKIASDFFKKSYDAGDIYKGTYQGLYCEGCEAAKTLSELNKEGQCLFHPTKQIQKISEENCFFKWSKYTSFLKELIESNPKFVQPEGKRKEMLAFIENGIEDIAVTRPKSKVSWGINCPIDNTQVIYVWFDALINYYTYGIQNDFWNDETEIIHILGKDNAKWHVLLWPAMLKSVGYKLPDQVYVHSFINLDGQKISKSRGNVVRSSDLVSKYGVEPVRYYFLRHGPVVEDVDMSIKHFEEVYNSDLANGLGNTVARITKLVEKSGLEFEPKFINPKDNFDPAIKQYFEEFRTDLVLQKIWEKLTEIDKHVNVNEPWKLLTEENTEKLKEILQWEIDALREVGVLIEPFLPDTSKNISKIFSGTKINSVKILFPRLS